MTTKSYPIIGTKSSVLWDEATDAWTYISGAPVKEDDPKAFYAAIPTLYRAVDLRAKTIANLPWALVRGEKEVESSDDYQNKTGLVANFYNMLYLIESSLTLTGKAYWKREKNLAGYNKIRHLDPTSMTLEEKKGIAGELVWERNANGVKSKLTTEEIIYLWYSDPFVELGPPTSWPTQTALAACGVLANVDEFAKNFFGRGAIKAMIFAMEGGSLGEAQKFEKWWDKYIGGIKNAFTTKVINAAKVQPVIVGEGMKELEKVTFTQEKREEIALAMSIPMSILFANSANYATAERDKLNWYEDFAVPEANMIASILNEQVFDALGLRLVFKPETLDIFQEDENERAAAASQFMDAVAKAESLEMLQALFLIYGFEVSDEAMALIEKHYADKAERAAAMTEQLSKPAESEDEKEDETEDEPEMEDDEPEPPPAKVDMQQLQRELSLWQSKCLNAIKRGEPASSVSFVPLLIPSENYERIKGGLAYAEDADAVRETFATAFREPEPEAAELPADAMMLIAQELKRANDLLEAA